MGRQAYEWAELHWDPFGEIGETVEQLVRSRDATRRSGQLLLGQLHEAALAFDDSRVREGCDQVSNLSTMLGEQRGDGVSQQAYQRLRCQVDMVGDALCSS